MAWLTTALGLAMGLSAAPIVGTNPDCRDAVEEALGGWTSRAAARAALPEGDADCIEQLGRIATGNGDYLSRSRAIALLATFRSPESVSALERVVEHPDPAWRCRAIQALAEIGSDAVLPILVGRLEDRSVCLKITSTDPAREHGVFVADEAIRALETVTGLSFEPQPRPGQHRDPSPWRKWWRCRARATTKTPPSP